jgi:hypothetical protein
MSEKKNIKRMQEIPNHKDSFPGKILGFRKLPHVKEKD